jgi:hypothetical protein
MSDKLDEMWQALEAHKPKRRYAKAWRVMLKKRTTDAATDAVNAAGRAETAAYAAGWAANAAGRAETAADAAARADYYAQRAIDAIAKATEVKP